MQSIVLEKTRRKMQAFDFITIYNPIYRDNRLTWTEKIILSVIVVQTNMGVRASNANNKIIAYNAQSNPDYVSTTLKKLKDLNLIIVEKDNLFGRVIYLSANLTKIIRNERKNAKS